MDVMQKALQPHAHAGMHTPAGHIVGLAADPPLPVNPPEVPGSHVALQQQQGVAVGAQLPHLCHVLRWLPVACTMGNDSLNWSLIWMSVEGHWRATGGWAGRGSARLGWQQTQEVRVALQEGRERVNTQAGKGATHRREGRAGRQ